MHFHLLLMEIFFYKLIIFIINLFINDTQFEAFFYKIKRKICH